MKKILVTQSSMPPYEEYIEMIKPLWESHWLTNMGAYHQQFEVKLKKRLNIPELSLMVNGHMALEMAIQAMNFPKGSEVITTPFTFISTTHAIVRNGLEPVFCDIKMSDYTIDETKIESLITEKTVAIIPVHVYGNVCNVEEIERIAYKYNLKIIYDAAHAFGETYKGKSIAEFGDASIFSFHATKVFNTIEGGAVCTHNHDLYERIYNLKNFGIRSEELVVAIGANAKMNEFQAIMGLLNLKYLDKQIELRKEVFKRYKDNLNWVKNIRLLDDVNNLKRNYAYFPILFEDEQGEKLRNNLYEKLKEKEIYARKYFYPITSDQACFKNKYKSIHVENARYVSERILILPMFADMQLSDVDRVCQIVKEEI